MNDSSRAARFSGPAMSPRPPAVPDDVAGHEDGRLVRVTLVEDLVDVVARELLIGLELLGEWSLPSPRSLCLIPLTIRSTDPGCCEPGEGSSVDPGDLPQPAAGRRPRAGRLRAAQPGREDPRDPPGTARPHSHRPHPPASRLLSRRASRICPYPPGGCDP